MLICIINMIIECILMKSDEYFILSICLFDYGKRYIRILKIFAYKNDVINGIPLFNWNVYWPVIGNLFCVLAYHWSFVLYDESFIFSPSFRFLWIQSSLYFNISFPQFLDEQGWQHQKSTSQTNKHFNYWVTAIGKKLNDLF